MPVTLDEQAVERSTYVVDVAFYDEDEAAVTPTAVTWTLTDELGNVVNSRDAVTVAAASTVSIVLSGLDLAVGGDLVGVWRRLLIEATYDSSLGTGLPLKDEVRFKIGDTVHLTGDD